MSNSTTVRFGDQTASLQDVTFYVFDESSNRALEYFRTLEYPEELDVAVDCGHASRVAAEDAIEAYTVLRRSLFMIDSMLQAGYIEDVRLLISDTLSDVKMREQEKRDTLIID